MKQRIYTVFVIFLFSLIGGCLFILAPNVSKAANGGFAFNMPISVEVAQNSAVNFLVSTTCTTPFTGPITNLDSQTTTSNVTYSFYNLNGNSITQVNCNSSFRVVVTASSNANPASVSGGTITPVTVSLIGTGSGIGTRSGGTFNVTIWGQPQITSFVATPAGGAVGATPSLSWQTSYATSCTASSNPTDNNWNGSKSVSGTQSVSSLNSVGTYSYTLSCSGSPGTSNVNQTVSVVISTTKIHVDFTINNKLSGYSRAPADGSVQMYSNDANYYVIDRTSGVVILPQGTHPQKLDITDGVIPGHTYQLVYKGGNVGTSGGIGKLYTHASPFITGGVDNNCTNYTTWSSCYSSVSTITPSSGQTVDFFINLLDNGTMSDGGSACPYTVDSNPYATAELAFRLNSNENGPHSVSGSWLISVTSGIQGTDFSSDNSSLYTTSPSNITPSGNFNTTLTWNSSNTQGLREAPGDYYFYPYSANGMNSYCSTIRYKLTIDPASAPTYTMSTSADTLYFNALQNAPLPSAQIDTLTNTGNQGQNYTANGAASWLTVSPSGFYLSGGGAKNLSFQPNTTALEPGTYSNVVRVVNDHGDYKDILIVYTISNTNNPSCPSSSVPLYQSTTSLGSTITLGGNTNAVFTSGQSVYSNSPGFLYTDIGDVNGDGLTDILTSEVGYASGSTYPAGVAVYLNNGNGSYTRSYSYFPKTPRTGYQDSEYPILVDTNNDGKLDIIFGLYYFDPTNSYALGDLYEIMGNGDGTFSNPHIINVTGGLYPYIPFINTKADFNNDGKMDLALISSYNNYTRTQLLILTGNGDGTFTYSKTLTIDQVGQYSRFPISFADVNKDGKIDVIDAGLHGAFVYLNTSTGGSVNFSSGVGYQNMDSFSVYESSLGVAIADFNQDGKLDMAVFTEDSFGTYRIRMYSGNGGGTFTDTGVVTTTTKNTGNGQDSLQAPDLNADGYPDLIMDGYEKILINNKNWTFTDKSTTLPGKYWYTPLIADFNVDKSIDIFYTYWDINSSTMGIGALYGGGNGYSGGTYSSSDPNIVSVSGFTLNALNAGTVDISGDGWAYTSTSTGISVWPCHLNSKPLSVIGPADVKVSKDAVSWTDGPLTISYGASPYVRFTANNNSNCTLTGNGNTWTHAAGSAGSYTSPNYQGGAQTQDQTYNLNCDSGSAIDNALVKVKAVPTMQSVTNSTDGTTPCGQVKITWVASGGSDTYNIYRNTASDPNNGGSVLIASGYVGNSYLYTVPQGVQYYYFVKSVDQYGNVSDYSQAGQGSALSCNADLSTSDIELVSINGVSNSPTPSDCNRNTQSFSPAPGLLRRGNKITFKVNICNSGGVDFVSSSSTPLKITSTMANLSFSPSDAVTYNCGGCTGSYQLTPGTGTTPDSIVFTINNGTLPKQSSNNPSVWSVTFSATTRIPTSSSASIFRFNHRADLQAGSINNSYSTPYYFFYFSQAYPIIKEVGH